MAWIHMFAWMAALIATWLGAAGIAIGWGWPLAALLRDQRHDLNAGFRAFWFGVCLTVAFLQIWHLMLPINAFTVVVWVLVGIVGWALAGRAAGSNLYHTARTARPTAWLFLAFILALFANRAVGWGIVDVWTNGDVNFYHLQAIQWNQTYAIVPGLGNLHSRLAFNNSCFLLQALAVLGPWAHVGYGIVNGLLALAIAFQAGAALFRLLRGAASHHIAFDILCCLTALPVLTMIGPVAGWPLFCTFSDQTEALLALAAIPYIYRAVMTSSRENDSHAAIAMVVATCLTITAATCKLSGLLYGAIVLLTLAIAWLHLWWKDRRSALPAGLIAVALIIVIFGVWALRCVILSGYPLYPSKLFAVSVPWRMPLSTLDVEVAAARELTASEPAFTQAYWLAILKPHNLALIIFPACIALAGLAWLAVNRFSRGALAQGWKPAAIIAIQGIVGMVLWAIVAPTARFAFSPMWFIAIGAMAMALLAARHSETDSRRAARSLLAIAAGFCGLMYVGFLGLGVPSPRGLLYSLIYPPASHAGHYVLPAPNVQQLATNSGLIVNVSTDGVKLWDAPLPATPFFDPTLRLRDPNNMAKGFEHTQ